jgi:hypothetical protein
MLDLTTEILNKLDLKKDIILKKAIRGLQGITSYKLIEALINTSKLEDAATLLGYKSASPIKQAIKVLLGDKFPDRSIEFGSGKHSSCARW